MGAYFLSGCDPVRDPTRDPERLEGVQKGDFVYILDARSVSRDIFHKFQTLPFPLG